MFKMYATGLVGFAGMKVEIMVLFGHDCLRDPGAHIVAQLQRALL